MSCQNIYYLEENKKPMLLAVNSVVWTSLMVGLLVLPVLALIHMLQHDYRGRHRLVWVLIIVFLPFFGSILYFIMGKRYRRHNPE
jgi:hypothetical protein